MRSIRLNDGQSFEISLCGEADGVLWLGFDYAIMGLQKAVETFTPTNTAIIVETDDFGVEHIYDGYMDLTTLSKRGDVLIISLKRVVS